MHSIGEDNCPQTNSIISCERCEGMQVAFFQLIWIKTCRKWGSEYSNHILLQYTDVLQSQRNKPRWLINKRQKIYKLSSECSRELRWVWIHSMDDPKHAAKASQEFSLRQRSRILCNSRVVQWSSGFLFSWLKPCLKLAPVTFFPTLPSHYCR